MSKCAQQSAVMSKCDQRKLIESSAIGDIYCYLTEGSCDLHPGPFPDPGITI